MIIKKLLKTIFLVLLSAALLCLVINLYVVLSTAGRIVTPSEAAAFGADAILVPGASVIDNSRPCVMLRDRLDTACLVSLSSGAPLIMSGDSREANYDESGVMADYAASVGISDELIIKDPRGISTYDSVHRARTVFGTERLVIVTQRYHLYRALFLADMNGIDAVGVASDTRDYEDALYNSAREFLARVKDFVSVIIGLGSSNIEFL